MGNEKNMELEFERLKSRDLSFYDLPCAPFQIYGLMEDGFKRMPTEVAGQVSGDVLGLHANTAGGRIRFKTNSRRIVLQCQYPWISIGFNFTCIGSSGFDLYADGHYINAFLPESGNIVPSVQPVICRMERSFQDRKLRDIVIHFPSYNDVSRVSIGLEAEAAVLPGESYRPIKPIVYYGSSITQGGCASHPGNSYQNMICREMNVDYVNLGFSGSCKAEPAMADYLAELDMSAFVYDYDHNAPDVAHLAKTHEPLFLKIREKQPELPVIMISVSDDAMGDTIVARRAVIRRTYENALAAGDRNVYFIDGRQMYREPGRDLCTVDGCHPNDLGFWCMAKTIGGMLKQILGEK